MDVSHYSDPSICIIEARRSERPKSASTAVANSTSSYASCSRHERPKYSCKHDLAANVLGPEYGDGYALIAIRSYSVWSHSFLWISLHDARIPSNDDATVALPTTNTAIHSYRWFTIRKSGRPPPLPQGSLWSAKQLQRRIQWWK